MPKTLHVLCIEQFVITKRTVLLVLIVVVVVDIVVFVTAITHIHTYRATDAVGSAISGKSKIAKINQRKK